MESARIATAADLPLLEALAVAARGEMRQKRGGTVLDRLDPDREDPAASVRDAMDDPSAVLAVGCIDEVPIAYGLLRVEPAADGRPHGRLDALYVDLEARSVGVGEALIGLILAEAVARGAVGLDAIALPGDRATKNFFESQGMVARAILVHRDLGDR